MIGSSVSIAHDMAFLAALYVIGASLCRLRLSDICGLWVLLYTALFGQACWYVYSLTFEAVSLRDVVTICTVAGYIFLTRESWANGVPAVARKSCLKMGGAK